MRKYGSKGRKGKTGRCPKCGYKQKSKSKLLMICCSSCGRKSPRSKWGI